MATQSPKRRATGKRPPAATKAPATKAPATKAPATKAPARLAPLARKVAQTGRAVSKAGARMSKPVMQSLKKEEPQTLAKMAMAAVAPKLVEGAVRFALRNPLTAIVGILVVSAVAFSTVEPEAAT